MFKSISKERATRHSFMLDMWWLWIRKHNGWFAPFAAAKLVT